MSTAIALVILMTLIGYISFYWMALTAGLVEESRFERLKKNLNWQNDRRRQARKSGWAGLFR